ncbi:hypothetical protein Hanom_Chr09g00801031 [Helianthus anomalus]
MGPTHEPNFQLEKPFASCMRKHSPPPLYSNFEHFFSGDGPLMLQPHKIFFYLPL